MPLANIGLNINLNKNIIFKEKINIDLKPFFDSHIINIRVYPGLNPEYYENLINENIIAVIVEAFGAGNFPSQNTAWVNFIEECVQSGKLVIIGSQSPHGKVDLELYKSAKAALNLGAISMQDMTFEAALVKLMILFGNYSDLEKIKSIFYTSIAGEITVY
jgi:L-asparaginase